MPKYKESFVEEKVLFLQNKGLVSKLAPQNQCNNASIQFERVAFAFFAVQPAHKWKITHAIVHGSSTYRLFASNYCANCRYLL